ncbi:MAG: twin-arginine translocase TatA/TatE family subunit [Treponema sp.]|nr:twin-arginine translocase TatA/TatE family subunit [Treponema sp.]
MFNIGLSELIILFFIAFIIVGPQDLPKVAKTVVRLMRKLRALMAELKAESGWDDMIKEIDEVKTTATEPLKSAEKEIMALGEDITQSTEDTL